MAKHTMKLLLSASTIDKKMKERVLLTMTKGIVRLQRTRRRMSELVILLFALFVCVLLPHSSTVHAYDNCTIGQYYEPSHSLCVVCPIGY